MRLGLLQCDVVDGELGEKFGDYPRLYREAFERAGLAADWRVFDCTQREFPKDVTQCDAYLISGSRHAVYQGLDWYGDLVKLVRKLDATARPLLGICFGHQVLADAFGAAVAKSENGWGIGIYPYQLLQREPWMQPWQESIHVPVCHEDQVLELPQTAVGLAQNNHCQQFFVQFSKTSLGLQGHPEFEPDFMRDLIETERDKLSSGQLDRARASLRIAPDNQLVCRWLANFVCR